MNTLRFHFALLVIGLFLIFNAPALKAQSALDGFDPNANGRVRAVVVQPDGRIIIGGEFTTVSPNGGATVARNRIARFNPDGTLDAAFNPNASGAGTPVIWSIVLQPDGKILVGGGFNSIGGQPRNNIARLDAATGLADSFNPNANNEVVSIALQSDGKILTGGAFSTIGGQALNSIARLDPATGLADSSFNPNPNSVIRTVAVQSDGKILVRGFFNIIGGQARLYIARLDPITGLADSFNPSPNYLVLSLTIQPDGKILVGGAFGNIGGQPRRGIARLDKDTGLADSFNPGDFSGTIEAIAVQTDGKILVGGAFNIIGGYPRNGIARLDAVTGAVDSFNPNMSGGVAAIAVQPDDKVLVGGNFGSVSPNGGLMAARNNIARFERDGLLDRTLNNLNILSANTIYSPEVRAVAVQPDGKILIGGVFTSVLGAARNYIARLNADGTLDTGFNPDASGYLSAIAVQPDGKILVGGQFSYIGGQIRHNIARLDKDSGLADSFNPDMNNSVNTIAIQPDGKILAGGVFTDVGGQTRNRLARLDATTGAPDSFNPNAGSYVNKIAIQPDGKILAVGDFTGIGGQARNYIARLDKDTGAPDSFNPNANSSIFEIIVQPDGKILVGGGFSTIGGQPRNNIARLDATTGLADSFNPNANSGVSAIVLQSDGKILVGGFFTGPNSIGGQARNRIARLNAATGAADSFNPNANSAVYAIALQQDGKILAGGAFTNINGQTRSLFSRLTNDTAAFSNLSVSRTTVTLTRDGAAALFKRVVFELSTDNGASWTTLGTATNSFAPSLPLTGTKETGENQFAPLAPQAASYTLTGLNLPTGQNILVRARGYVNGSESIEDKVQSALLLMPTAAQVSVSGRVITSGGSGLRNASVILTDANGNSRTVVTGSFGYFRFDAVPAGETYVVSVVSKRYQFAAQVVTINEELSELNFTAME